jgi:tRNA threonylcarbamoyl adenosine modification protein (Sua5/YciO/YrdC/YwlC family)
VPSRAGWQDERVTESSDETTSLDDGPAAEADGAIQEPTAAPHGEPTPDGGAQAPGDTEAESVLEPEPEPEPEREPVVVSADDLQAAIESVRTAIRAGESVVFPTDTVYGIAADPFSPQAVQGLLDAKHRGRDMPPPVLISDAEVLEAYTRDVPAAARLLANRYWPGPLTLILTAQSSLRMDLGETKGSIGVRVPDHEVARAILRATGPLAVSSANISGEPAATDEPEARRQLRGSVAVYVDGGATPGPTPSTIVDFSADLSGKVLRVGAIPMDELRRLLPGLEGPEPDPVPDEPAPVELAADEAAPAQGDAVTAPATETADTAETSDPATATDPPPAVAGTPTEAASTEETTP